MPARRTRSDSAAAAAYTSPMSSAAGRQLVDPGVGDGRDDDLVLAQQRPEHRDQALGDRRGVQPGEDHHQRPLGDPEGDLGDQLAVVGLDQHRLDGGHRVHERRQDLRRRGAQHAGPDVPVGDQQVDPVAGPGGQRGQQQGRVHGVVELGLVADPAGRGAARVQHDQHVPVALRPPGPHHDGGRPGGAPPVDGADVVAGDVLAQAVELGALAALQDGGPAVQLAQPGQPAGQVLAGGERRQRPDRPRRRRARPADRRRPADRAPGSPPARPAGRRGGSVAG